MSQRSVPWQVPAGESGTIPDHRPANAERMTAPSGLSPAALLIRRELELRVQACTDRLDEVCAHALLPTGKLLRPTLLLESADAVGGLPDAVLAAAVGCELGHVASLIHDDIIDSDQTRRGRASVPFRYGTEQAVVAGDFLIFSLFHALAQCRHGGIAADRIVSTLELLATVGMDMCRGEHAEFVLAGDVECGIEDYLAMAGRKTGALLRGACAAGALLGGGRAAWVDALSDFGHHLGVAFQIYDDLLPYVADEAVVGKAATSDVRNRRPTLPVILAHQAASPARRARLTRALSGELPEAAAYAELKTLLAQTGAVDRAREMAVEHARLAEKSVLLLPGSPARDRLRGYAELAITPDV